jgi:hypothetical protein
MNKTITVDFQEYMKIFDDRDSLQKEKQELNRHIRKLNEDINFLKSMGEDILIIYKNDGDINSLEFKVKEKQAINDIIKTANEFINKNDELKDINYQLKDTLDKSFQLIENQKEEIEKQKQEINNLNNRTLLERIFNKNRIDYHRYIERKNYFFGLYLFN